MPAPEVTPEAVEAVGHAVDGTIAAVGGAGTLTLGGLLWLLKRAFGLTIPRLANKLEDAITALTAGFASSLEKLTDAFREERRAERESAREDAKLARADFKEALKEFSTGFEAKLDKLTTAIERLDTTIRQQAGK